MGKKNVRSELFVWERTVLEVSFLFGESTVLKLGFLIKLEV
jgi:hypothetical protein